MEVRRPVHVRLETKITKRHTPVNSCDLFFVYSVKRNLPKTV